MANSIQYDFVDAVSEDYRCKRCQSVAREPHITSCCGETICKLCLQAIKAARPPCPSCGQAKFGSFLHRKYQTKIESLHVRCTYKQRGCEWIGSLGELGQHTDMKQGDCERVSIPCPRGCHAIIQRGSMVGHVTNKCPNRLHICSYCGMRGKFKDIDKHFNECLHFPGVCENGCGATFKREDLALHRTKCGLQKIKCECSFAGCKAVFNREDREEHMKQETQKHVDLLITAFKHSQEKVEYLQEKVGCLEEELKKQETELKNEQFQHAVRIAQLEDKLEKKLKELVKKEKSKQEEVPKRSVRFEVRSHSGQFGCCTYCLTGGKKHVRCGCGSRMPGGYSGCGHGHPGHPGTSHWSCCGSTDQYSYCKL